MSTHAAPRVQGPPEAAGPGIDQEDGRVIFGHNTTQRVVHDHRRSIEEIERDRAYTAEHGRCHRCADLDDATVLALATLVKAAREGRRL